ncbi:rubredoxin [Aquabacterium sp.]|uniref:rubredoxin n=1 Tax=Aquabacterium sp. TaxID=1872578 RepID=UPI0035B4030A
MNTPTRFEGAYQDLAPGDKLECSICWWVYDPEQGDDSRGIPPGTAFSELPTDWCCPGCDGPRHKFLKMVE